MFLLKTTMTIYIRDVESRTLFLLEGLDEKDTFANLIDSFEQKFVAYTQLGRPVYLKNVNRIFNRHKLYLPDNDGRTLIKLEEHKTLMDYSIKTGATLVAKT
jgi:hypothetical protein